MTCSVRGSPQRSSRTQCARVYRKLLLHFVGFLCKDLTFWTFLSCLLLIGYNSIPAGAIRTGCAVLMLEGENGFETLRVSHSYKLLHISKFQHHLHRRHLWRLPKAHVCHQLKKHFHMAKILIFYFLPPFEETSSLFPWPGMAAPCPGTAACCPG